VNCKTADGRVPVELLSNAAEVRVEEVHASVAAGWGGDGAGRGTSGPGTPVHADGHQDHPTVDDFLKLLPKERVDPALFLRTGWYILYPCIAHLIQPWNLYGGTRFDVC
jgi:hypothetical protein